MPKFRKRPVVVEAMQYEQHRGHEIEKWAGKENVVESPVLEPTDYNPAGCYLQIHTRDGTMTAIPGDWIIAEPFPTGDRRFYPCKPDIFAETYEPVFG